MSTLYLVRHGHVSRHSGERDDPALSPQGIAQAQETARRILTLAKEPLTILSSPLRRCRETAQALASLWNMPILVEPRVAEVPAPRGHPSGREDWVAWLMEATWAEVDRRGGSIDGEYPSRIAAWRRGVCEAVLDCPHDTVIYTHFVPINVLAAHALQDERVTCFRPSHASITTFERNGSLLRLVGSECHD